MDVADWLRRLGLARYEATFREKDVAAELLPNLTADDLKEIGISSLGHRRRLLEAIAALRHKGTPAGDPAPFSSRPPTNPAAGLAETTGERRQLTVMFCDRVGFDSAEREARPRQSRGTTCDIPWGSET